MLITSFQRALSQLPEPAFRKVLLRSLLLTGGLFIALLVGFGWLVDDLVVSTYSWLNTLAELGSFAAFFVVLLILFPAVSALFISFYLDDIAAAVEARYYPHDKTGSSARLSTTLWMAAQFGAILIVLNLLALPFYLLFLIFAPISMIIYYSLNGYLLSREYFELVAIRHHEAAAVKIMRKSHRRELFLCGVVIAFLLSVPIVNLIAPIFATAFMVHVLKHLEQSAGKA